MDDFKLEWINEIRAEGKWDGITALGTKARHQLLHGKAFVLMSWPAKFLVEGPEFQKLANFVMMESVGKVIAQTRGRMFDVKFQRITGKKLAKALSVRSGIRRSTNILFSVSNENCGWHTDGVNVNNIYDMIALYCINKAKSGGELYTSNFSNAFTKLKSLLPYFLMFEYLRPIPRDIIENGNANGMQVDLQTKFLREPTLLKFRAYKNAFPIVYFPNGDFNINHMTCRYMRYWIESGHGLAQQKISPFLRVAMDLLEDQLDAASSLGVRLRPGDLIMANNRVTAHKRNEFEDDERNPRHMVRTWISLGNPAWGELQ